MRLFFQDIPAPLVLMSLNTPVLSAKTESFLYPNADSLLLVHTFFATCINEDSVDCLRADWKMAGSL